MAAASPSSIAGTLFPHLPPAREIPSSFIAGVKSWWLVGATSAAAAEERLLRRMPYFRPSPSQNEKGPLVSYRATVPLDGPKRFINTLTIASTSPSPDAPPPAVLLHGYGAGFGFFFKNYLALGEWAAAKGSSVYAIDWLGMGRSARVPFTVKAKPEDVQARVSQAESFFVDSLEDWRQKMGLEKMTLIGHSLGAYLSVAYALRHPTRVSKLILLSPVGVPGDPDEKIRSIKQTSDTAVVSPSQAQTSYPIKVYRYLWEQGWSPFQIVRSALFYGPVLVGKYSSRRFTGLTDEETRDLHDYLINIISAKGSGEYCISHILRYNAMARMPLVDRIAALKMPVIFAYGDHDWMDPEGGVKAVENLRRAGNRHGRMYIVKDAGHQIFLDNPTAVNNLLIKELNRHVR